MNTSQITTLSKPHGSDRVPSGTLGYMRARNRHRLHAIIMDEFKRSGITQAELARRLGKGADSICRLLGAPGNWTSDTVSDLLFAIAGGEPKYSVEYPFDRPQRNSSLPSWSPGAQTGTRSAITASLKLAA